MNINFKHYQTEEFKDYKIVKYEEFKKNNPNVLKDLCEFLNLEFESRIMTQDLTTKMVGQQYI